MFTKLLSAKMLLLGNAQNKKKQNLIILRAISLRVNLDGTTLYKIYFLLLELSSPRHRLFWITYSSVVHVKRHEIVINQSYIISYYWARFVNSRALNAYLIRAHAITELFLPSGCLSASFTLPQSTGPPARQRWWGRIGCTPDIRFFCFSPLHRRAERRFILFASITALQ